MLNETTGLLFHFCTGIHVHSYTSIMNVAYRRALDVRLLYRPVCYSSVVVLNMILISSTFLYLYVLKHFLVESF